MRWDAYSIKYTTSISKVTWKYTRAILPHRCTITNNLLWESKHYKITLIGAIGPGLSNPAIFYKWINSSDGMILILSDTLEAAIIKSYLIIK
jgi:hypothetical protein